MIKPLLTCSLFCLSFSVFPQTSIEEQLLAIENTEQADSLLLNNKNKGNKIITFNAEKHKTIFAKELFSLPKGGVKKTENEYETIYYKVIEKNKIPYYRVSYIYLDGTKFSKEELTALRTEIVTKYNSGIPFHHLAKVYSMDANASKGGDLGWFTQGEMHPDFENKIINNTHDLETIFNIDIPERNWYYSVLKTHEPKNIAELKVLKIVEPSH